MKKQRRQKEFRKLIINLALMKARIIGNRLLTVATALLLTFAAMAANPKREFRGAWLHTVWQTQYRQQTTEQNMEYLARQLDSLKAAGVNAVIFQVRPQADAFYASSLEPWSRFLSDDGKAPVPFWDPLEYMVDETHARGMELHAWLNPYRVTTSAKQTLPKNHIYHKHPERFARYDGKLYFDPGLPENREFIGAVVDDIVQRYDIDGIHFDDYFYPYPVAGKKFPDDASYAKYGNGMTIDDWRRRNVDILIEDIHRRIAGRKPWVRFGVSPFGIWRNKTNDPRGSETSGLQNYDSLYADVLLWEEKGWIDYLVPQLYWELDHKSAGYLVLVDWWNNNAGKQRHLFIGQDIGRTMTENGLHRKISLAREAPNISGNCWWPGYALTRNEKGVADSLMTCYQAHPAIIPSCPWIADNAPAPVAKLKVSKNKIEWVAPAKCGETSDVVRFAVYRFENMDDIDIVNGDALVDITCHSFHIAKEPGVYVVTALDRINNESDASFPIIVK